MITELPPQKSVPASVCARKNFAIRCVASVVFLTLATGGDLAAQGYPTKSIKLVVPFGPGGPTDVAARLASQIVQSSLGQSVIIENRPGAGGAIGTRSVATADADGYTLLLGTVATLGALPAVVKTRAPKARPSWIAVVPMPEEPPCTSRLSPGCNWPRSNTLLQTVKKVSGRAAASTIERPAGTGRHCAAGAVQNSA